MDNGIELKVFLNEEVARLKKVVKRSLTLEDIKNDLEMENKTKKVLSILDEVKEKNIDKHLINKIFKIQKLVKEISD